MDYYNTLGVSKTATPDEIKQAYRKLASAHHPDKGGDTAQFQKIQEAYDTLGNPQKKTEYDHPARGGGGVHFGPGFSHEFNGGFPGGFHFNFDPASGMDMHDIFGQMFGHQRQQKPTYKTTIWISLEQVLNGGEQILQFNTHTGNQIARVEIPVGVDNGSQLRYDNLITEATVIIEYRIHQHQKFERQGLDLLSEVEVSVLDLILGKDIEFDTLSGKKFVVTIKPKTQPNTTLRISKQGLTKNGTAGDQLILIKPIIPAIIHQEIIDVINRHK
jgi:molecular chaperone DnaJ